MEGRSSSRGMIQSSLFCRAPLAGRRTCRPLSTPMWGQPEVLGGTSWQRCRVHFMRNLLALVRSELAVAAQPTQFQRTL